MLRCGVGSGPTRTCSHRVAAKPWCVKAAVLCVCVSAGVNLLVGTESGLMLLDRSGQGKVYPLINRRRFQQMDVLEGLNVLVTISGTTHPWSQTAKRVAACFTPLHRL